MSARRLRHFFFIGLLCLCSAPKIAEAEVAVGFDCYFTVGPIDCQSLRNAFFASMPYLKDATIEEVHIELRSFELDRFYRYRLKFSGPIDAPAFAIIEDQVLKTWSADGATVLVQTDLQRGMAPFLRATHAAATANGETELKLGDPSGRLAAPPLSSSPWYFNLQGSGILSSGTTTVVQVVGTTEVNYSSEKWRFNLLGSAAWEDVRVRFTGGTQEAKTQTFTGQLAALRTLGFNLSPLVVLTASNDPRNNLASDVHAQLGLEWDLIPILATNDHSLGAYYLIGAERQEYVVANVLARGWMPIVDHTLGAYLTWHFRDVDLGGSLAATTPVNDFRFAVTSLSANLTWRLTTTVSVQWSGYIAYRQALISQPLVDPNTSGLAQYVNGGNYEALTFGGSLSVIVTLGNSGLAFQDQRWRRH